jgi:hypothetical protein
VAENPERKCLQTGASVDVNRVLGELEFEGMLSRWMTNSTPPRADQWVAGRLTEEQAPLKTN